MFVCWLPYYICTYPGVVSNDSITQLKQILELEPLSNGNPVFQTFLWGAFVKLGQWVGSADAGVALYCCLQAILMAMLVGRTLQEMSRGGAPRYLLMGSMGFFAFCPVFPLFAFCVGKDTNFGMATLFLALLVWQFLQLEKGAKASVWFTIALCVAAALTLLLRNPGAYLAMLTLVLVLVWTLFQKDGRQSKRWVAPAYALGVTGVLWLVMHLALMPSLNALPMPETEEYSLPLQQVARVVASQGDSLTAQEREAIDAVMDIEALQAAYQGELSDPVKLLWKESAPPAEKSRFFQTWLSLVGKYPATCFSAFFHNTYGYVCPGYLSAIKPTLLIGKQGHTTDTEGLFPFSVNPRSEKLKDAMDGVSRNDILCVLLSPGLYGWIAVFVLAVLLGSRHKRLLLAAVPALFSLAGCMLSAVNGYFRYAMPLYFSAPLLLALAAQALALQRSKEEAYP